MSEYVYQNAQRADDSAMCVGVGEVYALATGGFLAERAHKMARRKNKKSYVPKPEWRARDLKANAGKGAQTKLRERERAQ